MKKNLLLIVTLFSISLAHAQIPNNDFETWEDEVPEGYVTKIMILQEYLSPTNAFETNDAFLGNSAIQLQTVELTSINTGETDTLIGTAYSGDASKNFSGFSFALRPKTFSGYFKTNFEKKDTASIKIGLYKWNSATLESDSIGGAVFTADTNVEVYTHFLAKFTYTDDQSLPDTAVVYLASSNAVPIPNSTLWVDNLQLDEVITSSTKQTLLIFTPAFPNPAVDILHINNVPSNASKIEVRDMTGKLVEELSTSQNVLINVSSYNSGLYHYSVRGIDGSLLYNDKFSVVK